MLKQDILQGRYDQVIREVVSRTKQGWEINPHPSSVQLLGTGIIRVYVEINDEQTKEESPVAENTEESAEEKAPTQRKTTQRKTKPKE